MSAVKMTVEALLAEVSGRTWEETLPYAAGFALVVERIVAKEGVGSEDDMIEIGAAVWASMDVQFDVNDVLDGEQSGEVISLCRHKLGPDVSREMSRT